jgi:hypothetical protein
MGETYASSGFGFGPMKNDGWLHVSARRPDDWCSACGDQKEFGRQPLAAG